jgi:hypothetical protein
MLSTPRTIVSALGALLLAASLAVSARADVSPGTTLDSSTADQAKDLLPPEILAHYQKNGYVNPIVAWPVD